MHTCLFLRVKILMPTFEVEDLSLFLFIQNQITKQSENFEDDSRYRKCKFKASEGSMAS